MKSAYGYLFVLCACALAIGITVSIGSTREESFSSSLAHHPEGWRLEIDVQNQFLTSGEEAKALLVKFLKKNANPSLRAWDHNLQLVLLAALFCGVGWLREKTIERK